MPADVKVSVFSQSVKYDSVEAIAIEFGIATGESIELWGVIYSFKNEENGDWENIETALSTDPSHLLNPPAALIQESSCYAYFKRSKRVTGTTHIAELESFVLPLYGLVRPKRQIWIVANNIGLTQPFRLEVYWSQFKASLEDIATINRKYGKYRRT